MAARPVTRLAHVRVGAPVASWEALGFDVADGVVALANGAIEFGTGTPGLSAIGASDISDPLVVDGLVVEPGRPRPATAHPNGARSIDHVVVMTDSLDRTSEAIESALGLERRRLRETETVRQAFHRFADPADPAGAGDPLDPAATRQRGCILELVENPRLAQPQFWGLVVIVDDLDALHGAHPDLVAPPKTAVQPGRRIATARREADLGTAVAFMTPER